MTKEIRKELRQRLERGLAGRLEMKLIEERGKSGGKEGPGREGEGNKLD